MVENNPQELHTPVMAQQCWELLQPALMDVSRPLLVDATLGMGGHSEYFMSQHPDLCVIGIDRDAQACRYAAERLKKYGQRIIICTATYDQIGNIVRRLNIGPVHGIMADLGVSSMQLDDTERGFSYSQDTDLDMRMDQSSNLSAKQLLNTLPEEELADILSTWGEEKFARRIAKLIVQRRTTQELTSSAQLVDLIREAIPAPSRRTGGNPAKRTFQALRIAVNNELDILNRFLPRALEILEVGGHFVVESYQSLEDRMVKNAFRDGAEPQEIPKIPIQAGVGQQVLGQTPWLEYITRGAMKANETEIEQNPRAASVRLRAVKKIGTIPSTITAHRDVNRKNKDDKKGRRKRFPTLEKLIMESKDITAGNQSQGGLN